jgi:hypothetical protein
MKKAILIDAINRKVEETTIESWRDIAPKINCDCFTVVQIDNKNDLYVDDEGLLKSPSDFIMFEGYPQPLAGSGLILGSNHNTGKSCDTTFTVEEIKAKVRFMNVFEVQAWARRN